MDAEANDALGRARADAPSAGPSSDPRTRSSSSASSSSAPDATLLAPASFALRPSRARPGPLAHRARHHPHHHPHHPGVGVILPPVPSSRAAAARRRTDADVVASASFVLGGVGVSSSTVVAGTGVVSAAPSPGDRHRRRGDPASPSGDPTAAAAAAAADRRRAAEAAAARRARERRVATYAWGRCDAGQLGDDDDLAADDVAVSDRRRGGSRAFGSRATDVGRLFRRRDDDDDAFGATVVASSSDVSDASFSASIGSLSLGDPTAIRDPAPRASRHSRRSPRRISAFDGLDVTHACGHARHAGVITGDGDVLMCGDGSDGQLGARATFGRPRVASPAASLAECGYAPRAVDLACGETHAAAVTTDGHLMTWGSGLFGQLGRGRGPDDARFSSPAPRRVDVGRGVRFVRVACGAGHTLALAGGGVVFSFGLGAFGATGHGDRADRHAPCRVEGLRLAGACQISAGENHSAALSAGGEAYVWGRGEHGQLGRGEAPGESAPDALVPVRVSALVDANISCAQIACGGDHVVALTTRGVVLAWGRGSSGPAGRGETEDVRTPTRVDPALFRGERVAQVSAGRAHSVAVSESGTVYSWGDGARGQLAHREDGKKSDDDAPRAAGVAPVAGLPRGREVLFAVAAGDHTVAVVGPAPVRAAAARGAPAGFKSATATFGGRERPTASGAATRPTALPPLLELAERVAALEKKHRIGADFGAGERNGDERNGDDHRDGGSERERLFSELLRATEEVFSSAGFLADGFALPPTDDDLDTLDLDGPRVDVDSVNAVYDAIVTLGRPELVAAAANAASRLADDVELSLAELARLDDASPEPKRAQTLDRVARAMTTLWLSPLNGDPAFGDALVPRLLAAHARLPPDGVRDALVPLLASSFDARPDDDDDDLARRRRSFERRLVRPVKAHVERRARAREREGAGTRGRRSWSSSRGGDSAEDRDAADAARALATLHAANAFAEETRGEAIVAPSAFYSAALSDGLNLRAEYMAWIRDEREDEPTLAQAAVAAARRRRARRRRATRENGAAADEGDEGEDEISSRSFPSYLRPGELTSFCQLAFALTPEAKGRILQGEANLQKRHEMRASHLSAVQAGRYAHDLPFGSPDAPFLEIVVDRERLLEDALDALSTRPPADVKKPLRVRFVSDGVAEEGIDEGGVTKEFFQLLVREMFDEEEEEEKKDAASAENESRMFAYDEESRYHWFDPTAPTDDASLARFGLFGAALGLAIYNGVVLDVALPPFAFRRLADERREPTLEDLRELSPSLARGLDQLLAHEGPGSVEEVFCRSFAVEVARRADAEGGMGRVVDVVELIPGGADVPVTASNREEFVRRFAAHTLVGAVAAPLDAFARGFRRVCGGPALGLFTAEELELLIRGEPELDVAALRRATKYDGGFSATHPAVVAFWSVVEAMDTEERRRLLFFTTGCDRAPVGGLGNLPFVVQRSGPDTSHLPTAHTCFNVLLLPEYASREKLRERLGVALANARGFGLQ